MNVVVGRCRFARQTDGCKPVALVAFESHVDQLPRHEESFEFTSVVVGDSATRIKQSYVLAGYTRDDGTRVDGRRINTFGEAAAVYNIRFYRDLRSKTKFQLSIGTWAGMQGSIEGNAKRLSASGTVSFDPASGSGEMNITSRRDALASVVGDVSKFKFSNFRCDNGGGISADLPLVTLEKANNQTETIIDANGLSVPVSKSVKWMKKASSVQLQFDVPVG